MANSKSTARDYSRRSYEKNREKVLARGRQRVLSGAQREAWQRWVAANRERERTRNRERMRLKREPQRLAKAAAREQRQAATAHARSIQLERQRHLRATKAERLKAQKQQDHLRHRDQNNQKTRAWRSANKERVRQNNKQWREANPERARANVRRWIAANPEKARALSRRSALTRRALEAKAFVEAVDPVVVYARAHGICGICDQLIAGGDKWHVDHIVPLAKGGQHSYANTQPAHAFCNISKGAKLIRKVG